MGYYTEPQPLQMRLADPPTDATVATATPADMASAYEGASCGEILAEADQNRKGYRNGAIISTAICAWLGHRLYKKLK